MLMHLNIRSISANHKNLKIFLQSLKIKPDVLICTETWLEKAYFNYELDCYQSFNNDSRKNNADGIIVYVSNKLISNHCVTHKIENVECMNVLSIIIQLKNEEIIKISSFYRNHEVKKNLFIGKLKKYLEKNKNQQNHALVGDFNINTLVNNPDSKFFINTIIEKKYLPNFFTNTRTNDKGSGCCIDNFFTKLANRQIKAFKLLYKITDHYPLILTIKMNKAKDSTTLDQNKKFFVDTDSLLDICNRLNWNISEQPDIHTKMDTVINKVKYAIKSSTKEIKLFSNNHRKDWVTKGIITSCEKKSQLYQTWKKDHNNKEKEDAYKKIL